MSTWPIAARRAVATLALALLILAGGCAPQATPGINRVALLAPFEGANRLIGYEALYAARMAAADAGDLWLELLPIDDGNSQASSAPARWQPIHSSRSSLSSA
ncbi:MAG: hypothetical protein IPK19_30930 [Chloroflexi bacterium]|nr:hypothetical protein [Chloroflexota bacterium]